MYIINGIMINVNYFLLNKLIGIIDKHIKEYKQRTKYIKYIESLKSDDLNILTLNIKFYRQDKFTNFILFIYVFIFFSYFHFFLFC